VIPTLQSEGYEVMSAQYGLDTNESDVATVKRTLSRVSTASSYGIGRKIISHCFDV